MPTQSCRGENRPQLDCSSEFRYDATSIEGSVKALGVGLTANSDVKALRAIDEQTAQYIVQARRLCDEYNACVLDRESYSLRSENLRRRMANVPELYEQIRNAPTPEAQRQALATAWTNVVPAAQQTDLEVTLSVLARRPGSGGPVSIREGMTLETGTSVWFVVQPSRTAYLYLFQRGASGTYNTLFPDARMGLQNPIPGGQPIAVPPGGGSYRLDNKDLGLERVYVVLSLSPLNSLTTDMAKVAQGVPPSSLETIGGNTNCETRALSFESGPSSNNCVRQRGLVLEPANGSSTDAPSLIARTEAADDVIVRVFTFNHVGYQ
jgi:hypothetical protein